MTEVQLTLLDRKQQDHNQSGTMLYAHFPRVPVAGDIIYHRGGEYAVSTVVLSTNYLARPQVVAKEPLV